MQREPVSSQDRARFDLSEDDPILPDYRSYCYFQRISECDLFLASDLSGSSCEGRNTYSGLVRPRGTEDYGLGEKICGSSTLTLFKRGLRILFGESELPLSQKYLNDWLRLLISLLSASKYYRNSKLRE